MDATNHTLTRVLAADGGLVAEVGLHAADAAGGVERDGETVDRGADAVVVVPLFIFRVVLYIISFLLLEQSRESSRTRGESTGKKRESVSELGRFLKAQT